MLDSQSALQCQHTQLVHTMTLCGPNWRLSNGLQQLLVAENRLLLGTSTYPPKNTPHRVIGDESICIVATVAEGLSEGGTALVVPSTEHNHPSHLTKSWRFTCSRSTGDMYPATQHLWAVCFTVVDLISIWLVESHLTHPPTIHRHTLLFTQW